MEKYRQLQVLDRALQGLRKSGVYQRVDTELSDADIMVLFSIAFTKENEKLKLTDIAKKLKVTLPAITHKTNDLVSGGYMLKEVSSEDLRVSYASLTEKGKNYVELVKDTYYAPIAELTNRLGEQDTKLFLQLIEKITKKGKIK